jgi:coenzyme F420 hydrogenase subunit beta
LKFEDIEKINIKEDLIISLKDKVTGKKTLHIPFDNLNEYMRSACNACEDFTNIYADISFGGLGSPEKYTTILARTEKGRSIILKAIKAEIVKCNHLNFSAKEQITELISQYCFSKVKRKMIFNNIKN